MDGFVVAKKTQTANRRPSRPSPPFKEAQEASNATYIIDL
jgi:hypothetical protein